MCTAIAFDQKEPYFGRTLDLEYRYSEEVVITPRGYDLKTKSKGGFKLSSAIIGIATVKDEYPLYYDATNEYGIAMAALNFKGNAKFSDSDTTDKAAVCQFELIPYILSESKTLTEAEELLKSTHLINTPYDIDTPATDLHYFLSDGKRAIAAESSEHGFNIYDDPFLTLTNNPPFPYHAENINNYMKLSAEQPKNTFSENLTLKHYSNGMGCLGIPGDLSSASRFVRAAFAVANASKKGCEKESVSQVFHILDYVSQTEGLVKVDDLYERTQYAICANLRTGTYYYKTYSNSRITAVRFTDELKSSSKLVRFPLLWDEDIHFAN